MKRKAASDYEQIRLARMQENKKRLMELGLAGITASMSDDVRQKKPHRRRSSCDGKPAAQLQQQQLLPARRSSRIQNLPAPSYKNAFERACVREERGRGRRSRNAAESAGLGGWRPEVYTEEHEKLLGSAKEEWVMFQDGYNKQGERVYDPVNGKTCHQCRQKTMGMRTFCSECQIVQGQFCGDCLYSRYGENVKEAVQNSEWKCPPCRGICNCSVCRTRKGWAPTGQLYKQVLELGYKSVAHFLIMTRRSAPTASQEQSKKDKDEQDETLDVLPLASKGQHSTSDDDGEVLDPVVSKEQVVDGQVIVVLSDGECDAQPEKPSKRIRVQPWRGARSKQQA